ncbi:hypothetical protein PPL_01252 [Heterostelium album PN500]|uniref:Uncharacterized protein n=1 Tax=Heterostelium pallidum (strain ATCC 26659 / Pp 5 / PN500) TaxID=670386 RepID=D3AYJ2_HETP5|nr:hypothetical protein PPL_01252 [Heterostelium album PN500]EFA86019.1 hypothetical protein PPL_01252 [Heterostelium album PN500]|eukprot:XP_020438125.1 hypothetical protein PPL_01252 [Heterostelium album PN500]
MGLFTSLLSIGVDAAIVSTGLAGIRRYTGFSVRGVANMIKNEKIKNAAVVYLNSGEYIFDKSVDIVNSYISDSKKNEPSESTPSTTTTTTEPYKKAYKLDPQNKSKEDHSIKVE